MLEVPVTDPAESVPHLREVMYPEEPESDADVMFFATPRPPSTISASSC